MLLLKGQRGAEQAPAGAAVLHCTGTSSATGGQQTMFESMQARVGDCATPPSAGRSRSPERLLGYLAAGLKATFTTAYMHTVIIYIVCLVFAFKVYTPGNLLAGIDQARRPRRMPVQVAAS